VKTKANIQQFSKYLVIFPKNPKNLECSDNPKNLENPQKT
jgi:hypothetical protein